MASRVKIGGGRRAIRAKALICFTVLAIVCSMALLMQSTRRQIFPIQDSRRSPTNPKAAVQDEVGGVVPTVPVYPLNVVFLRTAEGKLLGWTHSEAQMDVSTEHHAEHNRFIIDKKESSSKQVMSGDVVYFKTSAKTFLDFDPDTDTIHSRWSDMKEWQAVWIRAEGARKVPCDKGYRAELTGDDESSICLATHTEPLRIGDKVHLQSVQTHKYLQYDKAGGTNGKASLPGSTTRFTIETENLHASEAQISKKYPMGWSFKLEPPIIGEDGVESCDLKPIQSVLRRIPKGGATCRNRVIDFHCRNIAADVRLRMPRTRPQKKDGGQCPSNIHNLETGLITQTYDEKTMPKLSPKGRTEAVLGYIIFATPDESTMRQLTGLLDEIEESQNAIVVHIDAKEPAKVKAAIDPIPSRPNVRFISTRNITWGGFTLLQAEIDALDELLKMGVDWDYVINLSANAFPIKTKKDISTRLAAAGDVNHLEIFFQMDQFIDARGIRYWFIECPDIHRVYRVPHPKPVSEWRPLPQGIEIYAGSQWFMLSRPFIDFVMGCLQQKKPGDEHDCTLVRDFYEYCRYSLLSDEMFFQTLIMNGPFCKRVDNKNLHWVAWRPAPPDAPSCLHGEVVDWCGVSPSLVWPEDVKYMSKSAMLYARKFDDADPKSQAAKHLVKETILSLE